MKAAKPRLDDEQRDPQTGLETPSDLVLSTKIFWGGDGPATSACQRKPQEPGLRSAVYRPVDLVFCHPSTRTPHQGDGAGRGFNTRSRFSLYWGTSGGHGRFANLKIRPAANTWYRHDGTPQHVQ